MQGLLKIGVSENPSQRLTALQSTGVPSRFDLEALFPVSNGRACEEGIHRTLASFRVERNREFFGLSVSHAVELVMPIVSSHLPMSDENSPHHESEQDIRSLTRLPDDEHRIVHWISRGQTGMRSGSAIYALYTGDYKRPVDAAITYLVENGFISHVPSDCVQEYFSLTPKGQVYVHIFESTE